MSDCCGKKDWAAPCDPCPDLSQIQPAAGKGDCKQYIVTWTITIESDSTDGAVESALDAMAAGIRRRSIAEPFGAGSSKHT
jgi:hypothetical protein